MPPIYDPAIFDPHGSIGALVGQTRKALIDAIDMELAPLDISSAQWIVILLLATGKASTAGELSRAMTYDPGAMTRLLDRLENKGFLQRMPDETDRRAISLQLTRTGRALHPKIVRALATVNNRLLAGFTRPEADQLKLLLQRMLANA